MVCCTFGSGSASHSCESTGSLFSLVLQCCNIDKNVAASQDSRITELFDRQSSIDCLAGAYVTDLAAVAFLFSSC